MKTRVQNLAELAEPLHHEGGLVGHDNRCFDKDDDNQYGQEKKPSEAVHEFHKYLIRKV